MRQSAIYIAVALTVMVILLGALVVPVVDAMDERTTTEKVSDYVYSAQSRPYVQLDGRTDDITYTWDATDTYVNGEAHTPGVWASGLNIILDTAFITFPSASDYHAGNIRWDLYSDNQYSYSIGDNNNKLTLHNGVAKLYSKDGSVTKTFEYSSGFATIYSGYTMISYPTDASVPVDVGSPVAIFHEDIWRAQAGESINLYYTSASKTDPTWEKITSVHWDTDSSTFTAIDPTLSAPFSPVDGQNYVQWDGGTATWTDSASASHTADLALIAPLTYHEITTSDSAIKSLLTVIPLLFVAAAVIIAARYALTRDD